MIYLNRDRKTKELKVTDGLKSRVPNQKWRIYELNEKIKPFRLSRSKFSDYLTCKRCFYLEQVKGLKSLDTLPFTLNNAVDALCKGNPRVTYHEVDIRERRGDQKPDIKKMKLRIS